MITCILRRQNKLKTREALITGERAKNPRWSMDELEPWADAHEQVHEEVLRWMDVPPVDWRTALKQIQCPVMLVTGDVARGVIISPAQAQEAQSLNPKLEVANIANTGHCIRRDDFAPFITDVRNFLAKVS